MTSFLRYFRISVGFVLLFFSSADNIEYIFLINVRIILQSEMGR